jgi:glucose-6-phosphate-specific signal transduction histidine kinase
LRHGDNELAVRLSFFWMADAPCLVISSAIRVPHGIDDAHPGGHGLVGMRERAVLVGGAFSAGVDNGRWIVTTTIPEILAGVRP